MKMKTHQFNHLLVNMKLQESRNSNGFRQKEKGDVDSVQDVKESARIRDLRIVIAAI